MKAFIKTMKDKSKEYVVANMLFVAFILSNLINAFLLRTFTVGNIFDMRPFIADLAVLLILGSFTYFMKKPKHKFWYLFITSVILTAICVINSMYYTFYDSYASISLLPSTILVVDVGDTITKNVLELKDFTYLWQIVFFFTLNIYLRKRGYDTKTTRKYDNRKMALHTIKIAGIIALLFIITLSATEVNKFFNQRNRPYIVSRFGIYTYQINDIIRNINPRITNILWYDKALKKVNDFYNEYRAKPVVNEYTKIFEGKDLIMIHSESMQVNMMGLSFYGEEVTPTLNKLSKEGIFFDHFYSQVSVGTSSDTEFTISTSLLPVTNGTVFMSYFDRTFITMQQQLKEKGYYTTSMHGNIDTFWNRNVMHPKLGYDHFYSKEDYIIDDEVGLGLSDVSFFRQSVTKLKALKESVKRPIFATLISLSNHSPFDDTEKYGYFNTAQLEKTKLGNYVKSVHYADRALGILMEELEKAGLLDNAVIVIYGDHDARLPKEEYNYLYNYDQKTGKLYEPDDPNYTEIDYYTYENIRRVPFIIWTKNQKFETTVSQVMGMYDVAPTLGNMFGFSNKYALGHDIFSVDENMVVFPSGSFVTDKIFYNGAKDEYTSTVAIERNYVDEKITYAERLLDVSNLIVEYDLLKK